MTDIAQHIRIFSIDPDDDFVTKRTNAVKAIEDVFKKAHIINDNISLANSVAKGTYAAGELDTVMVDIVEKALKKQSAAFVAEGQELQIATCALIAALQYLEGTDGASTGLKLTTPDVFAIACWSALSFQTRLDAQPKTEALRTEVLEQGKRIVQKDSLTTRTRLVITELKAITAADDNAAFATNIIKAVAPLLEKLKTNATLDREEIDVLWWKLNDWSFIANKSYSQLNAVQSAILKGLELSTLLRRLPHQAHYHLIARVDDINVNAHELLDQLGDEVSAIKSHFETNVLIPANVEVFPLLNILTGSLDKVSFTNQSRSLRDWAGRALLEGIMSNMGKFLNDGN